MRTLCLALNCLLHVCFCSFFNINLAPRLKFSLKSKLMALLSYDPMDEKALEEVLAAVVEAAVVEAAEEL